MSVSNTNVELPVDYKFRLNIFYSEEIHNITQYKKLSIKTRKISERKQRLHSSPPEKTWTCLVCGGFCTRLNNFNPSMK